MFWLLYKPMSFLSHFQTKIIYHYFRILKYVVATEEFISVVMESDLTQTKNESILLFEFSSR